MTRGLGDANRYADPDYAKAGMLTKITYPTKGYTLLEYELKDFVDNVTRYPLAEDMHVGEEQATAINAFDCYTSDDFRSKDFTLKEDKEVTISFSVVSPYFYLSSCSSAYARISRTDGGNFIQTYQIPSQMYNEKAHSYTFTEKLTLEAGDYNVTCYFPPEVHGPQEGCESVTNISIVYYSEPDISESYDGISYGGGLRIASVEQHDADGTLLKSLSLEAIIAAEPDYIFAVLQGSDPTDARQTLETTLLSNPAWGQLTAVREGRFYTLDHALYNLKPNARWGEAYEKLADILYP